MKVTRITDGLQLDWQKLAGSQWRDIVRSCLNRRHGFPSPPSTKALAFAQFLKLAGHSDYLAFTAKANSEEAYRMLEAANKIREALAAIGIAPR